MQLVKPFPLPPVGSRAGRPLRAFHPSGPVLVRWARPPADVGGAPCQLVWCLTTTGMPVPAAEVQLEGWDGTAWVPATPLEWHDILIASLNNPTVLHVETALAVALKNIADEPFVWLGLAGDSELSRREIMKAALGTQLFADLREAYAGDESAAMAAWIGLKRAAVRLVPRPEDAPASQELVGLMQALVPGLSWGEAGWATVGPCAAAEAAPGVYIGVGEVEPGVYEAVVATHFDAWTTASATRTSPVEAGHAAALLGEGEKLLPVGSAELFSVVPNPLVQLVVHLGGEALRQHLGEIMAAGPGLARQLALVGPEDTGAGLLLDALRRFPEFMGVAVAWLQSAECFADTAKRNPCLVAAVTDGEGVVELAEKLGAWVFTPKSASAELLADVRALDVRGSAEAEGLRRFLGGFMETSVDENPLVRLVLHFGGPGLRDWLREVADGAKGRAAILFGGPSTGKSLVLDALKGVPELAHMKRYHETDVPPATFKRDIDEGGVAIACLDSATCEPGRRTVAFRQSKPLPPDITGGISRADRAQFRAWILGRA